MQLKEKNESCLLLTDLCGLSHPKPSHSEKNYTFKNFYR